MRDSRRDRRVNIFEIRLSAKLNRWGNCFDLDDRVAIFAEAQGGNDSQCARSNQLAQRMVDGICRERTFCHAAGAGRGFQVHGKLWLIERIELFRFHDESPANTQELGNKFGR